MVIPVEPRDTAKPSCAPTSSRMTPFSFRNRATCPPAPTVSPAAAALYVPAMSAAVRKLCAVPTSSPHPDGAGAEAADTQPICPALVVQGTSAAAGADNEPCLDDRKVDSAGLRIAT